MFKRYWAMLIAVILLSPLGLLAQDTAWGEWAADELNETLGYVPQGISRASEWWHALLPDYSVPLLGNARFSEQSGYIVSALIGSAAIYSITIILTKVLKSPPKAAGEK